MNPFYSYQPRLDTKQTLLALNDFKSRLLANFQKKLKLYPLPTPLLNNDHNGLNSCGELETRLIQFDSCNLDYVVSLLVHPDRYKRWFLSSCPELKGIIFEYKSVIRDGAVSPFNSISFDYIEYELLAEKDMTFRQFLHHSENAVNLILTILNKVRKLYDFESMIEFNIHNLFEANYFLQKRFLKNPKEFDLFAEKEESFFVKGVEKTTILQKLVYDYAAFSWDYLLVYYYYYPILNKAIPLVTFKYQPSYKVIENQIRKLNDLDILNRYSPYINAIKKQEIMQTYGGSINLSLLQLITLEKHHLAEVHNSCWSSDDWKLFLGNKLMVF